MTLFEVPLGNDAGQAQYLSAVFAEADIDHQLILGTDPKALLSRECRHRALADRNDLADIEAILADHAPNLLGYTLVELEPAGASRRRSAARLLIGMPALALGLAAILTLAILVVSAFS